MLTWEDIPHNNGFYLRRSKVFGGWLVIAICDALTLQQDIQWGGFTHEKDREFRPALTFIPDPNHEWKIDNMPYITS